jgi:hypothetical protein
MLPEIKKYTVWVDGHEVTSKFITYSEAKRLLNAYEEIGAKTGLVDDIIIREGRDNVK